MASFGHAHRLLPRSHAGSPGRPQPADRPHQTPSSTIAPARRGQGDLAMTLSSWLLQKALRPVIRRGSLRLILPSGESLVFGDSGADPVIVRLTDNAAVRALLMDPDLRTGELFTDARLVMEQGSIYDFLSLVLDNDGEENPSPIVKAIDRLRTTTQLWRQRNDPGLARRNVAHHYDLG
ncbi:MAG: hypothetical protein KKC14_04495, partial [Alphaproteobacteria bacterium]|nr:hypothetical protein [Alphaproteobacteria bacterium]